MLLRNSSTVIDGSVQPHPGPHQQMWAEAWCLCHVPSPSAAHGMLVLGDQGCRAGPRATSLKPKSRVLCFPTCTLPRGKSCSSVSCDVVPPPEPGWACCARQPPALPGTSLSGSRGCGGGRRGAPLGGPPSVGGFWQVLPPGSKALGPEPHLQTLFSALGPLSTPQGLCINMDQTPCVPMNTAKCSGHPVTQHGSGHLALWPAGCCWPLST